MLHLCALFLTKHTLFLRSFCLSSFLCNSFGAKMFYLLGSVGLRGITSSLIYFSTPPKMFRSSSLEFSKKSFSYSSTDLVPTAVIISKLGINHILSIRK